MAFLPDSKFGYVVVALWITVLGILLMVAPNDWYGPSWSYFSQHGEPIIPAGGFGMGLCCAGLGTLQLVALWRNAYRVLMLLFFLGGFVLWTAGLLLGVEGLAGHQGLMEAPFMMTVGVHKFVVSASLAGRRSS